MDLVGWRNMNEFACGLDFTPSKEWTVNTSARWYSLRDPSDAWYADGGSANSGFIDPTGSSGRYLGMEIDLEATYRPDKHYTFGGGISFFNPGTFVRNIRGGHADVQTWGFLYAQFKF